MKPEDRTLRLLFIVSALVMLLGFYVIQPVTREGVVAAKSITSERDEASFTIITFHEDGVSSNIEGWEELFPNTTKMSAEVEYQLGSGYDGLRYVINLRTDLQTMGYFASREDFNNVEPGDHVRFQILRGRDPMVKIIRTLRPPF
ncbi:MAG TPA: hypothetical protein VM050_07060 [Patescibacteria group bacterium]|nr:hypothetical protein [Patescibacteria group bacterium]